MPRSSRARCLVVWMNGERVGTWSILPSGTNEFHYDESWLQNPAVRPLSLSMPLVPTDFVYHGSLVESFFDNLLPDSIDIRRRLQRRFGVRTNSPFDLLAEIGRDCVGAVQLLPEDELPQGIGIISAQPLDESDVAEILRHLRNFPLNGQENRNDFRISIAGAQEKTAFLWHEGCWSRPIGTTPSTHIFKLPLGLVGSVQADMHDSVENEWLCMHLAQAYGLPAANTQIADFEDQHVLIVERFDRRLSADGKWWLRLPQEDFCQVTGTPAMAKYERDGGPGIIDIMKVLLGSINAIADRKTFLKAQVLYWILAAPDGHAKNFSVFITQGGHFRMTPLYDIVSAYPVLGHGKNMIAPQELAMAMAVSGRNRHYKWSQINGNEWRSTASKSGASLDMENILQEIIEDTPRAVESVTAILPPGFPATLAEAILDGVQKAIKKL